MNILITKSKILQGAKPANTEVMNKPVSFKMPAWFVLWKWRTIFHFHSVSQEVSAKGTRANSASESTQKAISNKHFICFFLFVCLIRRFESKKKKKLNHLLNVEKSVKNPVVFNWSSKLNKVVAEETVLGFRFGWRQRNEGGQGRISRRMWGGGR